MSEKKMMKAIYADPPYKGQARKHYKKGNPLAEEVDFVQLCKDIQKYDAYALSIHVNQLQDILPLLPGARIACWVKPFAVFKKGVNPTYAWEPVLFKTAKKRNENKTFLHDWLCCNPVMQARITGQKPVDFCYWIFRMLNLEPGDKLIDAFPGSGAVSYSWEYFVKYYPDFEKPKDLKRAPIKE